MTESGEAFKFPRRGTTYLPVGFPASAVARFANGIYEPLIEELLAIPADSYERAGVDRALAIAIDLAVLGGRPGWSVLDIGCSTGLISMLLASVGYRVTGIDNDAAPHVQSWQDPERVASARKRMESGACRLLTADMKEILARTETPFDVTVCLNVLHHMMPGYGYTGYDAVTAGGFRALLARLCAKTRRYIYLEAPQFDELEEMPSLYAGDFSFPEYFLRENLAVNAEFIASAIATNGKARRLYRVDLA